MVWFVIAFIVAVAVLAPILGSDSRDSADWKSSLQAPDFTDSGGSAGQWLRRVAAHLPHRHAGAH